tara:strand:- start:2316 stop:2852 length:537 start_codon:yes stop_codon:yes gene_type:complete
MADISVSQYKKLSELTVKENSTEWLIQAISILCAIDKKLVEQLTMKELERIGKIVSNITDIDKNNQPVQKIIEYKGKRYGFHPNLSKLTVGEFADLETFCDGGYFKNINEILGILYRPIVIEAGDFYTIEEYDAVILPDHWQDLNMNVVLGATNFFLSIGVTLTKGLANYLVEEATKT